MDASPDQEPGAGGGAELRRWLSEPARDGIPALVPAATVILVRDSGAGGAGPAPAPTLEVLVLRRNSKLAFGGMWVFPGGRVDEADQQAAAGEARRGGEDLELAAARRAGVREAAEEAGLVLDPDDLVPYSHWTPPDNAPKRFATWFFVAPAPPGTVTVDGGEVNAHRWVSPAHALRLHHDGEIELAPPTWITMATLSTHGDAASTLAWARGHRPEVFVTRIASAAGTLYALYDGDAGYHDGDAERSGARHRLAMAESGWSYVRPDGSVIEAPPVRPG